MSLKEHYYTWEEENLKINLKIQTNASKNAIIGELDGYLKIAITSPPIDGKANECLIKFLAKHFGASKNKIKMIKGIKSKYKTVTISNPQDNLDTFKPYLDI